MALPKFKTRKTISSQPEQFQTESPQMASSLTRESANLVGNIEKAGTSIAKGVESYQTIIEKKRQAKEKYHNDLDYKTATNEFKVRTKYADKDRRTKYEGTDHRDYAFETVQNMDDTIEEIVNNPKYSDTTKAALKEHFRFSRMEGEAAATSYEDAKTLEYGKKVWEETYSADLDNVGGVNEGIGLFDKYTADLQNTTILNDLDRIKKANKYGDEIATATLDGLKSNEDYDSMEALLDDKYGVGEYEKQRSKELMSQLSSKSRAKYKRQVESLKKLKKAKEDARTNSGEKDTIRHSKTLGSGSPTELKQSLDRIINEGGKNSEEAWLAKNYVEYEDSLSKYSDIQSVLDDDMTKDIDTTSVKGLLALKQREDQREKFIKKLNEDPVAAVGVDHPLNTANRQFSKVDIDTYIESSKTARGRLDTFNSFREKYIDPKDRRSALEELAKQSSSLSIYSYADNMSPADAADLLSIDSQESKDYMAGLYAREPEMKRQVNDAVALATLPAATILDQTNTGGSKRFTDMVKGYTAKFIAEGQEPEDAAQTAYQKIISGYGLHSTGHSNFILRNVEIKDAKGTIIPQDANMDKNVDNFAALVDDLDSVNRYRRDEILPDIDYSKQDFFLNPDGSYQNPTPKEIQEAKDRFWSPYTDRKINLVEGADGPKFEIQYSSWKQGPNGVVRTWHSIRQNGKPFQVDVTAFATDPNDKYKKLAISKERNELWGTPTGGMTEWRLKVEELRRKSKETSGGIL